MVGKTGIRRDIPSILTISTKLRGISDGWYDVYFMKK
jgi:hypothetical protein